jgi:hypothetical protein
MTVSALDGSFVGFRRSMKGAVLVRVASGKSHRPQQTSRSMTAARDSVELISRIEALLADVRRKHRAVDHLLSSLRAEGRVALFGGAVRDLALMRPREFRSDLDLVVDVKDDLALQAILSSFDASRNRHGGFRLRIDNWRFDVWGLSSTWAIRRGHVDGRPGLGVLPSTTFFTWDAVAYGIDTGILYTRSGFADADEYLADLVGGVLDVNLEPNPNPLGNVIRALRFIQHERARELGERLTQYALRTLQDFAASGVGQSEGHSQGFAALASGVVPPESAGMAHAFLVHAASRRPERFRMPKLQYQLGL